MKILEKIVNLDFRAKNDYFYFVIFFGKKQRFHTFWDKKTQETSLEFWRKNSYKSICEFSPPFHFWTKFRLLK